MRGIYYTTLFTLHVFEILHNKKSKKPEWPPGVSLL